MIGGRMGRWGGANFSPHFGILILVWGCIDPHFGSGIPKSVWGFFVIHIPISVWGSPFLFGDPHMPAMMTMATARWAMARQDTMAMTMATGDNNNDDGDTMATTTGDDDNDDCD